MSEISPDFVLYCKLLDEDAYPYHYDARYLSPKVNLWYEVDPLVNFPQKIIGLSVFALWDYPSL